MKNVIMQLLINVQNDEQLLVQTMMTQHTDGTVKISQDVISVRMDIQTRVMVFVQVLLNVEMQ